MLKAKEEKLSHVINLGTLKYVISRVEKNRIESIWNKLSEQETFYQFVVNFDLDQDFKVKSVTSINKILNTLKSNENIEALVLKLFLYHQVGNRGAVNSLIRKFLNSNPFFISHNRVYPYKNEDIIQDKIIKTLTILHKDLYDDINFQSFLLKFISFSNKYLKDRLLSDLSLPTGVELNKIISSPTHGISRYSWWLRWISENELLNKNMRILVNSTLTGFSSHDLFFLKDYFVEDPIVRKKIFIKIKALLNSKNWQEKLIFFEIVKNSDWLDAFFRKDPSFKINLIKDKRIIFRDLLNKGKLYEYAIFELFKMSDFSREYFIYLLALKSYGLSSAKLLSI